VFVVQVRIGRFGSAVTGVAALVLVGALVGCSSSDPTVSPPTAAPQSPSVAPTTAAPSPSVSKAPLSPYENDPAVKALRKFYAAVSKAINARNLRLPELDAWSTPRRQLRNAVLFKTELGLRAPGPLPFTPLGVRSNGANSRSVLICAMDGFNVDPKTGKPTRPRVLLPGQATLVRDGGRWKVDFLVKAKFSCAGVRA
jgi:hypothetical protein